VADLVAVAVLSDKEGLKKVETRINRRLWKGARAQTKGNPSAQEKIDQVFKSAGVKEPDKLLARALPENAYPLWMAITDREIVEEE
jgi:hypothetical protein